MEDVGDLVEETDRDSTKTVEVNETMEDEDVEDLENHNTVQRGTAKSNARVTMADQLAKAKEIKDVNLGESIIINDDYDDRKMQMMMEKQRKDLEISNDGFEPGLFSMARGGAFGGA